MYRVLWRFEGSKTWHRGIFVPEEKLMPGKRELFIARNRALGIEARFVGVEETESFEYGRSSSALREEDRPQ